jgi:hypothetical protein
LGDGAHQCESCHRPQHGVATATSPERPDLMARTKHCSSCHNEVSWKDFSSGGTFDHASTGVPLLGGHARAPCSSCHRTDRPITPPISSCTSCHEDRHAGKLGDRCENCHSSASWKPDETLADHRKTRFPLIGAHAAQGCYSCHQNASAGDFRGLDPTCRSCHATLGMSHHGDVTAHGACENCHSQLDWAPHINHDAFFHLDGQHTVPPRQCTDCHLQAPAMYGGTPTMCSVCHAQRRMDFQTSVFPHAAINVTASSDCGTCHDTTSWGDVHFDHNAMTGYDLNSRHSGFACSSCHPNNMYGAAMVNCTTGGCHNATDTNDSHNGRPGYTYGPNTCIGSGCHSSGTHGG